MPRQSAPLQGAIGRVVASIITILVMVAPTASSAEFCSTCSKKNKPVCGMDGQTYLNDCIRKCAAVVKAYNGKCSGQCYPYTAPNCAKYNWDSTQPVCAFGLTFTNQAEAACAGTPKSWASKCWQKGVCKYGVRGSRIATQFKTPKGRGGSIKKAVKDTSFPSRSRSKARYSYSEALTKSLIFYDSMISGKFAKAHKRLTWRANSCQECYNSKYKKDLSGGFYEAGGSYLKFPLINSYMAVMLAWEGIEEGPAMRRAGVLPDLRWKVKWAADYLMACHVAPYVYVGLNGNDTMDFDYFGPPELYSKYVKSRPFGYITKKNKGSEVLADAAAALAAASAFLKDKKKWSALALKEADFLYQWARTSPGSYMNNKDPVMKIHANLYSSQGYVDELAWAALWLYKATGKSAYLAQAKGYYAKTKFNPENSGFELNNKRPALSILMSNSKSKTYRRDANAYFNYLFDTNKATYTKKGLYYPYHWGAARHGANAAWLALVYAKNNKVPNAYRNRLRNFAHFQVNYLLGDSGRSWIVGFGKQPNPIFQWHKASYNSYLDYNPQMAKKILAMPMAGPWSSGMKGAKAPFVEKGKLDFEGSRRPQRRIAYGLLMSPLFNDNLVASRKDYTYTEPTLEYPAGLVGALASMSGWYKQGPYKGKMKNVLPFKN